MDENTKEVLQTLLFVVFLVITTQFMTSRTPMADLLKGIAVMLMIQVHILENFASNSIFNSHGEKSTQI